MDEKGAAVPFLWIEEPGGEFFTPERTKRKVISKKKEYVGWASRSLIEFLQSLGRETKEALSPHDVTSLVIQYATKHKLINPAKKKKIVCDDTLRSLFGKKNVSRIKIHELLEPHFTENQDSEDELFHSSEEKEGDASAYCKVQTVSSSNKHCKKKDPEVPKTCFAAINTENIKLIYLRRSLVLDLLKCPETFDVKLVGSLVRVKSDPYDYLQRNSHQLQLVTGVKRTSKSGDNGSEVLLEVSNTTDAISIPMLSDDNFSEDECKDLHQRMKDGLLKQPTVGELEQKAQVVHEDITKHSIARELIRLQNLIDQANEKGRRRELWDYLERRKLLQNPNEVSLLLHTPPKVMAEEIIREVKADEPSKHVGKAAGNPPRPIQQEPSYHVPQDGHISSLVSHDSGTQGSMTMMIQTNCNDLQQFLKPIRRDVELVRTGAESNGHLPLNLNERDPQPAMPHGHLLSSPKEKVSIPVDDTEDGLPPLDLDARDLQKTASQPKPKQEVQVIELSDDEEDNENPSCSTQVPVIRTDEAVWHYVDPQGSVQGPFSMASLKRWSDAEYFPPDFKVWRTGQSQAEAVLLVGLLLQMFT